MKLLFLTFYYSPDLSAGSFRSTALVRALVEQLPPGSEIDVVTTLPNRYRTFTVDVAGVERAGPVTVHRIALPRHRSGMADQSRAFLAFGRAAMAIATRTRYDAVFATSSRLMTATLGSIVARRARVPFYLDVRDIFVENISDVLPKPVSLGLRPALAAVERFAFSRADHINLVSRGFAPYFERRYSQARYSFHPNGVDDEFVAMSLAPARPPASDGGPLTILYAGNIGEGQGLNLVLPELAVRLRGRARFRVIGDGGRRAALEAALAAHGVSDVEILPPVARDRLVQEYAAADVLFLHLNDYKAFERLLPSKIFEYAATGKPVWAGVGGYAAHFLREKVENAAVFAPCDVDAAEAAFHELRLTHTPRRAFVERFSRATISAAMATEIIALASSATRRG